MSVETFIARRYLRAGRSFAAISTWISILGVCLGVGTVCFVMSMHNGFEAEIRTRLLHTTSHVTIYPADDELIPEYPALTAKLEQQPHVVAASPFVFFKAAISSASTGDGIAIRGIDSAAEARASTIADQIVAGQYRVDDIVEESSDSLGRTVSDTAHGMLLGVELARSLGVGIGDPVVLYSLRGEDLRRSIRPRIGKFQVTGIFESGMFEFDGQLAYISLPAAQRLFRTGDAVTAIHLKLDRLENAITVAGEIDSALERKFTVVPWQVMHRNLFGWIETEKLVLFLGFTLIVVVAAFSIISTLVMLTMQKRPEIGILKTMGMAPVSIRKVFIWQSLVIGGLGVLSGWVLAFLASWIQNTWQVIKLPGEIYFVSYLPIDVHWQDFLAAGLITMIVCLLAGLYPAMQASRISVLDVLRE